MKKREFYGRKLINWPNHAICGFTLYDSWVKNYRNVINLAKNKK